MRAADRYGFRRPRVVEQLFVDFAVCRRLAERLHCTIFGGMCMHLHSSRKAQRLSRDVDIMTTEAADGVDMVMHDAFETLQECRAVLAQPRRPHPIKGLRSYRVHYESLLGGKEDVKVDFLCGFGGSLPTEVVRAPHVLGVDMPFGARVLTKGALLADKMTTLALGGVGLPEWRLHDAPKQVYDIAALVRMAGEGELAAALGMLNDAIESRIALYEGSDTVQGTVASIQKSIEGFVNFKSAAIMSDQYKSHLENFRSVYLQNGGERYQRHERIGDLFIAMLFGSSAGNVVNGTRSAREVAKSIAGAVAKADRLLQGEEEDRGALNAKRRSLQGMLSHKGVAKGFFSGLSQGHLELLEAVYASRPHQQG